MQKRRKVRFIEPRGYPDRPLNAWITRWPLLGPITLATILHQRGFDARVYNENISGPLWENASAWEDLRTADVIGISIMTPTARRGYMLADHLREQAPHATIVIGGVHASMLPEESLLHADLVVCGEAETLIEAIARGEIERGIVRPEPLQDLDRIPTLNYSLMCDWDRVLTRARKKSLYELPMMTSRGCPYGCTYCSVTQMFGRRMRRQSVDKVMADITRYRREGYRQLFFYDDNFTADRKWCRQLMRRMEPLGMRFNCQVRADFACTGTDGPGRDDDLLDAMRAGGGAVLFIGYETVDDATAGHWHKGYRGREPLRQRLAEHTRTLHEYGFWIHAMFVMGPQHDEQTASQIVDFARECRIESIQISLLTPLPGTELYEQLRPHLLLTNYPDDWDYYDSVHCVYDHARLGVEGMQRVVHAAHRRFYRSLWNPGAIGFTLKRSISAADKAIELWQGIFHSRNILRRWRREQDQFLHTMRQRELIP